MRHLDEIPFGHDDADRRDGTGCDAVDLEFYFPVAAGDGATAIIEALTHHYMAQNPDVSISGIYARSYADTTSRAITGARGGNPPQMPILLSVDMFAMIDEDVALAWDDFLTGDEIDTWIGGLYPSCMLNIQTEGKTWGIPFQHSA